MSASSAGQADATQRPPCTPSPCDESSDSDVPRPSNSHGHHAWPGVQSPFVPASCEGVASSNSHCPPCMPSSKPTDLSGSDSDMPMLCDSPPPCLAAEDSVPEQCNPTPPCNLHPHRQDFLAVIGPLPGPGSGSEVDSPARIESHSTRDPSQPCRPFGFSPETRVRDPGAQCLPDPSCGFSPKIPSLPCSTAWKPRAREAETLANEAMHQPSRHSASHIVPLLPYVTHHDFQSHLWSTGVQVFPAATQLSTHCKRFPLCTRFFARLLQMQLPETPFTALCVKLFKGDGATPPSCASMSSLPHLDLAVTQDGYRATLEAFCPDSRITAEQQSLLQELGFQVPCPVLPVPRENQPLPGPPLFLEIFSGTGRITSAIRAAGMDAIGIDKQKVPGADVPPVLLDITSPQGKSLLHVRLQNPRLKVFWAAPACGTCSAARNIPRFAPDGIPIHVPKPLRSRRFPDGLPFLAPPDARRVDLANASSWPLRTLSTAFTGTPRRGKHTVITLISSRCSSVPSQAGVRNGVLSCTEPHLPRQGVQRPPRAVGR